MSFLVFRVVTGALCGALVLAGCGDDGSDGGNGGGGTGGENTGGTDDTGGSDGVGGDASGGAGGAAAGTCGWNPIGIYACGYSGEDPDGNVPYDCPANPMEGDPCGDVTGAGCCAPDGSNWYCSLDGGKGVLTRLDCSG